MDDLDVEIINRLPSPVWRDESQVEAKPQPAQQEQPSNEIIFSMFGLENVSL